MSFKALTIIVDITAAKSHVTTGYLLTQMLALAQDVKISRGMNCVEATVARIRGFFGTKYFVYRFVGNLCFIAGIITEYLGYELGAEYPSHLRVDSANNSSIDDDEANYVEFHPVKIGVCLQGIAIVILERYSVLNLTPWTLDSTTYIEKDNQRR